MLPTQDQSISFRTWWDVSTCEHTTWNKIHRFLGEERPMMNYLSYCINLACHCQSTQYCVEGAPLPVTCLGYQRVASDEWCRWTHLWNAGLSRVRSIAQERAGFLWTSHLTCGKDLLAVELWTPARNGGMGCTSKGLGPLSVVWHCWGGSVCQTAAEAAQLGAGNKPPKNPLT